MSAGPTSHLVVYDGKQAIGELEDFGRGYVVAYTLTPIGRLAIGKFPDHRSARRAIEVHSPVPPGAA